MYNFKPAYMLMDRQNSLYGLQIDLKMTCQCDLVDRN